MKEIGIEQLREQFSNSPAALAWMDATLGSVEEDQLRELLREVDESDYTLRHWIDAFIELESWMDARELSAGFGDQIGYVSCACAAAGAGANLSPLSSIVTDMLESYGFERAERDSL